MRYNEFNYPLVPSILSEVSMKPGSLQRWASGPDAQGILMGIEFEMIVPGAHIESSDEGREPDYDYDTNVNNIDDIIEFFEGGDMTTLGGSASNSARDQLEEEYYEWANDQVSDEIDRDYDTVYERVRGILEEDYDFDIALERAQEEAAAGEIDSDSDAVDDRAKQIRDQDIEELMDAQDSDEYLDARDQVKDSLYDEYRDLFDERDWLRSLGVRFATDAERQWSELFDWGYVTEPDSEVDLDDLAAEFAAAIGISADELNLGGSYHGAKRESGKWIIEPDSSIHADTNAGQAGLEFISPAQPIATTFAQLKKLMAWAKRRGCTTDTSTGLHINVSVPGFSLANLDYIKLALFMGDEYILDQFGRASNQYCRSATNVIVYRAGYSRVEQVLQRMRSQLNTTSSKIIHDGITTKYVSINPKSGYVEFRGPGGDYLSKTPEVLCDTALRLAMALKIACDESAHKQEYSKKLYKLISPLNSNDDTVNLFAKYTAGDLPKEEMMSILRQKFQAKQGAKAAAAQLGTQTTVAGNTPDPYTPQPGPISQRAEEPGQRIQWDIFLNHDPEHVWRLFGNSSQEVLSRVIDAQGEFGRFYLSNEFTVRPSVTRRRLF